MRPNPDSQAPQQVVAADTMEDPAVADLAAAGTVVVWEQVVVVVVAARFMSPTSVASLPYVNLQAPCGQPC